ncbi:MAG: glycine cleavage system protein GcvH [Burkholderiales bacterium]|nr:glycine cleavage system protein GcvH [Burkholderiales bacterium]|tara:strand:- start:20933 stop:21316 length:384 start_codon:yes stop_codon:yes gene_type:complete
MANNKDMRFSDTHQWISSQSEGVATIGISDYAQESLGDIVYIDTPTIGDKFKAGEQCGVIESVKTASDLFMPVDGEVVAINESLSDQPELINKAPHEAWIFEVKVLDPRQIEVLKTEDEYMTFVEQG